jgi:hypothetical protein
MVQESLSTIFHVEIYALIGFIIFFTFFIVVSVQAFKMKKEEENKLSSMPLDELDIHINQTTAN